MKTSLSKMFTCHVWVSYLIIHLFLSDKEMMAEEGVCCACCMVVAILYGIYQQPRQWRVCFDANTIFIFFLINSLLLTLPFVACCIILCRFSLLYSLFVHIVTLARGLLRLLLFHFFPSSRFNTLHAELNPICHLLVLLGAHHILHVSRIRVNNYCQVAVFNS